MTHKEVLDHQSLGTSPLFYRGEARPLLLLSKVFAPMAIYAGSGFEGALYEALSRESWNDAHKTQTRVLEGFAGMTIFSRFLTWNISIQVENGTYDKTNFVSADRHGATEAVPASH